MISLMVNDLRTIGFRVRLLHFFVASISFMETTVIGASLCIGSIYTSMNSVEYQGRDKRIPTLKYKVNLIFQSRLICKFNSRF